MPSLRELEAEFIRYEKQIADEDHGRTLPDGTKQYGGFEIDVLIPTEFNQAQGIMFLCPLCFKNNGGPINTHSVHVSFANRGNIPLTAGSVNDKGEPSRWEIIGGSGLDDLQLSPSIFTKLSPCQWHGFIGHAGVPAGHAQ